MKLLKLIILIGLLVPYQQSLSQTLQLWVSGDSLQVNEINKIDFKVNDFKNITALQLYFKIDKKAFTVLPNFNIHSSIEKNTDIFYVPTSSTLIVLYYSDESEGVSMQDSATLFSTSIEIIDSTICFQPSVELIDEFDELIIERLHNEFIPLEYIPASICTGQKDSKEEPEFKLINFLSPDSDGKNDLLHFEGLDSYPIRTLDVFNRWGEKVYSSHQYNNDWDGTVSHQLLPDGTYYYILAYGEDKVVKVVSMLTLLTHKN